MKEKSFSTAPATGGAAHSTRDCWGEEHWSYNSILQPYHRFSVRFAFPRPQQEAAYKAILHFLTICSAAAIKLETPNFHKQCALRWLQYVHPHICGCRASCKVESPAGCSLCRQVPCCNRGCPTQGMRSAAASTRRGHLTELYFSRYSWRNQYIHQFST